MFFSSYLFDGSTRVIKKSIHTCPTYNWIEYGRLQVYHFPCFLTHFIQWATNFLMRSQKKTVLSAEPFMHCFFSSSSGNRWPQRAPFRGWNHCEPGSSVSIVSGYGLDDWAIEVLSPAEARDTSSGLCVQTGSGAHPASCTMGPFPGVKHSRSVTLTTHPHLVPRSRMSSSYTSSPPKCLHGV
jgi:hypothetical protein